MSVWMMMIVISGIVFMHKEITSTGEIVIHVHPYDFTQKSKKHHHKSDAEIQYLNVVFSGAYVATDFLVYEKPLPPFEYRINYAEVFDTYFHKTPSHSNLRGPPSLA